MMDTPDIIFRAFPALSETQRAQIEALGPLYADWNAKINVISRRDIDNLFTRHVLHSLAIAKFVTPCPGSRVIDLGCGGGFPGIPLAILWPEVSLHLIDRVGKKVKVASAVAEAIGLSNVSFQHGDALECHEPADYVVSRAVMRLADLVRLAQRLVSRKQRPLNRLHNGLITLKGGELEAEMAEVRRQMVDVPLTDWFSDPYFETKRLVFTPC